MCSKPLPLWRVFVLAAALFTPVLAHAAEESWLQRLVSFDTASAAPVNMANSYELRQVNFETTCLVDGEKFRPLFNPYINKPIDDATVLRLMRQIRSSLAKQGFRNVQMGYPTSKRLNGAITISIAADVPSAMLADAKEQCSGSPIRVANAGNTTNISQVLLGGMVAVDPLPFVAEAQQMRGKKFNSVEVIRLMQKIRTAYRNAKQPLPYISFDRELAHEGTLQLTVVEKKRKNIEPEYVSPEDIPVRVAKPAAAPAANPPQAITQAEQAPRGTPIAEPTVKPAVKPTTPPAKPTSEGIEDKGVRVAQPKPPTKTIVPVQQTDEDKKPKTPDTTGPAFVLAPTAKPSADAPVVVEPQVPADFDLSKTEDELIAEQEVTEAETPENVDLILVDDQATAFLDGETPVDLEFTERTENELLILETFIEGEPRDEALLAYSTTDTKKLLISLTSFVNALGVPINVNPESGRAEGWYITEDNQFLLNYPFEHAVMGQKRYQLKEGSAELHFDDIYVSASALEGLFNVNLELNFSALQLFITPKETLPYQAKNERYVKWNQLQKARDMVKNRPQAPRQDIEYQMAAKPTVRIDTRTGVNKRDGSSHELTQNISAITQGDLFGFSHQTVTSLLKQAGEDYEIDSFEVLFRKQDDKNDLFGPLNASMVQWGDITLTPTPLIEGTRKGRGIEVSNQPISYVRDPNNLTIEGFAPPNWDVEVFQDERLVDFITIDSSGRYEFTAVPLRSGLNIFRIVEHGPNGELRETTRRYFLGTGQVKEGEFLYSLAALEGTKPLIEIGNNADRQDLGSAFQLNSSYGLTPELTLTSGLYNGAINTLDTTAATVGLRASVWESFLQLDTMAEENGGRIYSASARRNFTRTFQLLVGGETSSGFSGTVRPDKSSYYARIDNSIQLGELHPIGFSVGYRREFFNDGQSPVTRWQNRLNTFFNRFNVSNELELEQRENTPDLLQGDFLVRKNAFGGYWRGQVSYRNQEKQFDFESINLRGQFQLAPTVTYIGEINRTLLNEKETRLNNRLTWEWDALRLGLETEINNSGEYRLGFNVGTTFVPNEMGYTPMASRTASSEGNVLVRVFLDENEDKIYQEGEEVLPGVTIRNRSRGGTAITTDNGVAALGRMAVFQPNQMLVDSTTLPDFYMQPADALVSVIARPGIIGTVDMPIYLLGEIAGTITLNQGGETTILEGAPVTIYDEAGKRLSSLKSEYDGFYVFPSLRMGNYKLVIPAQYLERYGIEEPIEVAVNLQAEENIMDMVDIEINAVASN